MKESIEIFLYGFGAILFVMAMLFFFPFVIIGLILFGCLFMLCMCIGVFVKMAVEQFKHKM